jgi:hypothetical protein
MHFFHISTPAFLWINAHCLFLTAYNRCMGKLVKRAELSILGTLGIALFSYTHMPAIMSALDGATSTDQTAYSASAAAAVTPTPYVADTVSAPTPVTITTTPVSTSETPAAGTMASSSVEDATPGDAPQTTDANAVLPTDSPAQDPSAAPNTPTSPSDSQ